MGTHESQAVVGERVEGMKAGLHLEFTMTHLLRNSSAANLQLSIGTAYVRYASRMGGGDAVQLEIRPHASEIPHIAQRRFSRTRLANQQGLDVAVPNDRYG